MLASISSSLPQTMCWFTGRASNQLPSALFSTSKGNLIIQFTSLACHFCEQIHRDYECCCEGCDFQIGVGCASSAILWPCWRTQNIMMMMIMTWWIISCAPLWVLHPWFVSGWVSAKNHSSIVHTTTIWTCAAISMFLCGPVPLSNTSIHSSSATKKSLTVLIHCVRLWTQWGTLRRRNKLLGGG